MILPDQYPTDTAVNLIYAVDPLAVDHFRKVKTVFPLITFFQRDGDARYGLDVLNLFQAPNPTEAARRKALLIPTALAYLKEKSLDPLGYVFMCMGFSADPVDEKVKSELAAGRPIGRLTRRVPVLLYAAERSEADGSIACAYGEREVQLHPHVLLKLEVRPLAANPGRIGFGILSGIPKER